MDKEQFIAKIKEQGFSPDSYIIFGSGILAVLGIRPTQDIDILVNDKLYVELARRGWKTVKVGSVYALKHDVFDVHSTWSFSDYETSIEKLQSEHRVYIEGIPFVSLEEVARWKSALRRPKDLRDLELIRKYLDAPKTERDN